VTGNRYSHRTGSFATDGVAAFWKIVRPEEGLHRSKPSLTVVCSQNADKAPLREGTSRNADGLTHAGGNAGAVESRMIEELLCGGVHPYGSVKDTLCYYVYNGTLTDTLFAAVVLLSAICFLLVKLR
jgi:hypothetical protein